MTRSVVVVAARATHPLHRAASLTWQRLRRVVHPPLDVRLQVGRATAVPDDLGVGVPEVIGDAQPPDVLPTVRHEARVGGPAELWQQPRQWRCAVSTIIHATMVATFVATNQLRSRLPERRRRQVEGSVHISAAKRQQVRWPTVPGPGSVDPANLPNGNTYAPCMSSRSVHCRYHKPALRPVVRRATLRTPGR